MPDRRRDDDDDRDDLDDDDLDDDDDDDGDDDDDDDGDDGDGPAPGSPGAPYLVTVLYAGAPEVDGGALLARLSARCGPTEAMGEPDGELFSYAFTGHCVAYADQAMPAMAMITPLDAAPEGDDLEAALQQTWDWPDARQAVAGAGAALLVSDFCADGLPPVDRLNLVTGMIAAVVEAVPGALAIVWSPAGRVVSPADFLTSMTGEPPDPVPAAVNVRYYDVRDRRPGEAVMDTCGLAAIGLPDVQIHFVDLEPGLVASFLGGVARYLLAKGPVIEHGDRVPGPEGQPWAVRHEAALVGPPRPVIDIDPHPPHSAR